MFKLDNALLEELGLGSLSHTEKNKMLAHIYETLEMRVGMKLAEQMSNDQLDEFESYIDKNDEAGALKWLESNFPNYKQVVADQLELLKTEVKQSAPQIVAASQQSAAMAPSAPSQPSVTPAYQTPNEPPIQSPQVAPPAWQPPVAPAAPVSEPTPPSPMPASPYPPQPSLPMTPPAQPLPQAPPQQLPIAPSQPPYQAPSQPPFQPMPPQWQPPAPGIPPQDDQSNGQSSA